MTQLLPAQRALAPNTNVASGGGADVGVTSPDVVRRYLEAIYRHKWVVLLVTVLGIGAGIWWTKRRTPVYQVRATIWLSSNTPEERNAGPIRPSQLLNASSWPELLGSFAILDSVALKERLYILPDKGTPRALFASFAIGPKVPVGRYHLRVDSATQQYDLLNEKGQRLEHGCCWTPRASRWPIRSGDHSGLVGRHRPVSLHATTMCGSISHRRATPQSLCERS